MLYFRFGLGMFGHLENDVYYTSNLKLEYLTTFCKRCCYITDVDLECLATWREGADNYFFGRLFGKDIDTNSDAKNSKYRCFVSVSWLIEPFWFLFAHN